MAGFSPDSSLNADFKLATPLIVDQVKLKELRCHQDLQCSLVAGLNLIIGANGSGKTSVLEAIYLMAHGRSFRQSRSPLLVRHGEERFFIQGQWRRFGPMNLSVAGRKGQTSLRLQGRDIQRRKDVSESFPVLVEAPQGRKIIDGAPGERRRWLDQIIMICYPQMHHHYNCYLRAVMQRGRLLRRKVLGDELAGWEKQIVHYGLAIVSARQRMLKELNGLLLHEQALTEDPLKLSMNTPVYEQEMWLQRLQNKRTDDAKVGSLRFGPHVDGLDIHFQQREIRSAGSRGQQKLAAIALKMAECALWSRHRRLIPVILLDDCLEALDQQRQLRLFQRLQRSPAQILMTAPDAVSVSSELGVHIQLLTEQGLSDFNTAVEGKRALIATKETTMEEAA